MSTISTAAPAAAKPVRAPARRSAAHEAAAEAEVAPVKAASKPAAGLAVSTKRGRQAPADEVLEVDPALLEPALKAARKALAPPASSAPGENLAVTLFST